jgi:hypothetical protein
MNFKLSNVVASPPRKEDFIYQPLPGPYPLRCKSMLKHVGQRERQGTVGTCTGTTAVNIAEFFLTRAGVPLDLASKFPYDYARVLQGRRSTPENPQPGAQLRDAVDALRRYGIPREELYRTSYDSEVTLDPSWDAVIDAHNHRIDRYELIAVRGSQWIGIDEIKAAVQSALMERCPLAIAMPVTRSIYDLVGPLEQQVYHVPSENAPGNEIVGNHAMMVAGYDEYGFIPEGSWDYTYGDNGIIRLPWRALENVLDLIVIRKFAGFGSDFHTRFFTDRETSRATVMDLLATPQALIDLAVEKDITEYDLECVAGFPAGSIRNYAANDPIGKTLDWQGWL